MVFSEMAPFEGQPRKRVVQSKGRGRGRGPLVFFARPQMHFLLPEYVRAAILGVAWAVTNRLEKVRMKGKSTTILAVLLISGCAVPTSGVVPAGDGMFTVTRQGSGAWVATDTLKAEALKEAGTFCETKGKGLQFIHNKEIPAGPLGRWPERKFFLAAARNAK